jgi:DNA polymerase
MRLDKDYLLEMELWSHFEMRGLGEARVGTQSAPSITAEPAAAAGRAAADAGAVSVAPPAPLPRAPMPRPVATVMKATAPSVETALPIDPARVEKIAQADWKTLAEITTGCAACVLCKQRKQAVFGVGALAAHWLFIGEGPGAEEDQTGEPFVGQAGKLLDAMLAAAGLQRGREVYIANVVKCRPPGNRTPQPDEAAACAPLLDRQIDLIQPKIIVALGKTAITRLTGSDAAMAALRGRVHTYRNIPVIATYHPAYLLRNLPEKMKAWEDLQLAKTTLAEGL